MKIIYKEQDISEFVTSFTWSGSRSEVARKLDLKIVNAPTDDNIIPPTLELAELVYLYDDDNKELFRGFITDREASSVSGEITYTAYDLLFYTLKSSATYNFSGKTAEAITKMVCEDMEIPVGELASTGIAQKLIVQNVSIYEIIMQAYTQAHQQNDKSYKVTAKAGKLNVEEMGKVKCTINLSDETNVTSSKYTETLANMVNKVRIYDGEGNQIGVVQNDEDIKYGIFQQTYTKEDGKDANTTAKSMFKSIEKTFELSCTNYNECVTGSGVEIRDVSTGLSGLVWIDADSHSWQNGVATMSLTVTLKYIMDTKDFTTEKASSSTSASNSGTTSGGGSIGGSYVPSGTQQTKNGSRDKPPFKVGYRKSDGSTVFLGEAKDWDTVVSNLLDYGKLTNNPVVLDSDGKEIDILLPTDEWYTMYTVEPKDNPPFFIFNQNKELYTVQGKVNQCNTLSIALNNINTANGFERGWGVLDADYRFVSLTYFEISKLVSGIPVGSQARSPFSVKKKDGTVLKSGYTSYAQAKADRDVANKGIWGNDRLRYYVYDRDGDVVFDYATRYK